MIIKKVTLNPFGNIRDKTFKFEDGKTNVILGETGAGKTTLFDAMYSAFVIDSEVRRNSPEYKDYIEDRYPLDGSNIVQVKVEFEVEDENYKLTKVWSKDKSKSEATLEGDSISMLKGDRSVNEVLEKILPSNKGTLKNVLMAYQTKIQDVFSIEEDEVYSSLDEKLRKSMESEGVSPKEFLEWAEEKFDEYSSRWNFERDRPERTSQGTLYKQGTGEIYEAYKALKNKKDELEEVKDKEDELGDIEQKINELTNEIEEVEEFLEEYKKAYDDSGKRENLELKLENKNTTYEELENDYGKWESAKETISTKKGEINILESNLSEKKEEKEELEKYAELEEIQEKINQEEDKLRAGKLEGKIEAKKGIDIKVKKDMESEGEEHPLEEGEKENISANNRIQIYTDDFDFGVKSGEGDFSERVEKIDELDEKKENKAQQYDVDLPLDEKNYSDELEEVEDKIEDTERDIDDAKSEIEREKETIEDIKERYEISSLSEISDKKNVLGDKIDELNEELDGLEEIPTGFSDISEFKDEYEKYRDEKRNELMEEKHQLLEELKMIDVPDIPSEELEDEVEEKEREFERRLQKGKAYRLLKKKTEELMEEGDLIYGELKASLEGYFKRIYGKEFEGINMDEFEVQGVSHPDGYEIPRDNLSTGEKDITALSTRLAMADYYLKETDGFMVMDDPLVNIDPEKKKNASKVIDEASEEQQIIIMTCTPEHAELFDDANIVGV